MKALATLTIMLMLTLPGRASEIEILFNEGDCDKAVALAESAGLVYDFGINLVQTGKTEQAAEWFKCAIEHDGISSEATNNSIIGLSYVRWVQGDYKASAEGINWVLTRNPSQKTEAIARYLLAQALLSRDDLDQAQENAELAVSLYAASRSSSAIIRSKTLLSNILYAQGRNKESLSILAEAESELASKNGPDLQTEFDLRELRADIYITQKRFKESYDLLLLIDKQQSPSNPAWPVIRAKLALAAFFSGNPSRAYDLANELALSESKDFDKETTAIYSMVAMKLCQCAQLEKEAETHEAVFYSSINEGDRQTIRFMSWLKGSKCPSWR